MEHELKTINPYFQDIWDGKKKFELRKNDRNYKVGDSLVLKEYNHYSGYSGRQVRAEVGYILKNCPGLGLDDGYCILGFKH